MTTIKIIKTSTLLSLVTILVNCGGGDSSSSEVTTISRLDEKATIAQVSVTRVNGRELANLGQRKPQYKSFKMQLKANEESEEDIPCGVSGTFDYQIKATDTGGTIFVYLNKKCQYIDTETGKIMEENGVMLYEEDENGVGVSIDYKEYTLIPDISNKKIFDSYPSLLIVSLNIDGFDLLGVNGEAKFITDGKNIDETYKYKDYYYISDGTYVHIEGSEKITNPCGSTISNLYADYNGEFNFLTKHDSEPEYYKSGIIVVNGLKYDYRDEDVILSKDNETETVSQASILAQKDSERSSCSQKVAFSPKEIDVQKFEKGEYLNQFKNMSSKIKAYASKNNMKK